MRVAEAAGPGRAMPGALPSEPGPGSAQGASSHLQPGPDLLLGDRTRWKPQLIKG